MQPAPSSPSPESSSSSTSSERDSSPDSSSLPVTDSSNSDDSSLFDNRPFYSPTHDTSRTRYHMRDLATFAKHLEQAASSTFPNKERPRYKSVRVLLFRWEEDSLGVEYELDDLAKTFAGYGFDTETWIIPTVKSHRALMQKSLQVVDDYGEDGNLLIVYYAGHGRMSPSRQAEWTCSVNDKPISLQWHAIQTLFEQAESDVLLLLDCCAAASGVLTGIDNTNVTETIAACGFETWAPQPGRHSFTNTLISVMEEWQNRPAFTAAMLHCEILTRLRHEKPERYRGTKKFEYRKSPIHVLSTSDTKARSIEIAPRRYKHLARHDLHQQLRGARGVGWSIIGALSNRLQAQSITGGSLKNPYGPENLTDPLDNGNMAMPHVLLSLALEEEQLLHVEQCRKWLQDFPILAKSVTVQGVYRSNSTLLILSVPVLIWDMLPNHPSCTFIGYAHSRNLLEQSSQSVERDVELDIFPTHVHNIPHSRNILFLDAFYLRFFLLCVGAILVILSLLWNHDLLTWEVRSSITTQPFSYPKWIKPSSPLDHLTLPIENAACFRVSEEEEEYRELLVQIQYFVGKYASISSYELHGEGQRYHARLNESAPRQLIPWSYMDCVKVDISLAQPKSFQISDSSANRDSQQSELPLNLFPVVPNETDVRWHETILGNWWETLLSIVTATTSAATTTWYSLDTSIEVQIDIIIGIFSTIFGISFCYIFYQLAFHNDQYEQMYPFPSVPR